MSPSSRCPECGAEVPEGAGLLKLCPQCLLKQALPGESTEASPEPLKKTRTGLPERYGAYRPVGVLGEGGMGIVYLAEQDQPIRRRVALKVIKQGMDTRQVIARFESERQALALMDHPNIAHVYDAGATPEGRPYFAMEYVPGIPITDYCDKYLLGTRERLDLFMKVCAAIQHAHQKGVIHRDIKPSNVLVMIQDGQPVPKVIDFGVAKATSQRLTEKTMFTEFGVLIGTPAYMSPEQAEMTGLDVDSTTDIYSLGVLLYELLVGALPFDAQMLKKAGYDEIRRIIREVEPPRPTTRLHSMGPPATGVARRRQSDVRSLERLLRGDLDWIAMKALEKDRTRRYASASEFAADVLRHLSDEPVQASPPGAAYRAGKFLRKHRAGVLAVAGLVTVSMIGAAVSSVMYVRAERRGAEALRQSYVANIYAANLHLNSGEKDAAIRRLLQCDPSLRGWEWRHLWYRADSSIATLYTPQHFTLSPFFSTFGFSRDGSRIYWNARLALPVWDASSYQPITRYEGLGEILALSSDGTKILARRGLDLNVMDPGTGVILSKIPVEAAGYGSAGDVNSAAFSSNGLLAVGFLRTIGVWDLASGREVMRIKGGNNIVFSPDGRRIASVDGVNTNGGRTLSRTAAIWDVRSGKLLAAMEGTSGASPPAFSPDGARLAEGTTDGTIFVWDSSSGKLALTLSGHQSMVREVAFSPDGASIASVSQDNTVRIWDATSGGLLSTLVGDDSTDLWSVAFSPDGTRLLAGSKKGEVRVWDATRFGGTLLKRAKQKIDTATISANGARIALGFPDRTVEVLDTASGKSLAQWIEGGKIPEECPRHPTSFCIPLFLRGISVMTLSPDGSRIIVGLTGGAVHLRDAITGRELVSFSDPGNWAHVAFDGSGSYVVSTRGDKAVRVWDASSGRVLAMVTLSDRVNSVVFNPEGDHILIASGNTSTGSANDATVQLWDWKSDLRPEKLDRGKTSNWPTDTAAFSPDGRTVIADVSASGELSVWDTASRKLMRVISAHESGLRRISFSPDGSRFATADNRSLRVWDAAKYELLLNSNTGATFAGFARPDASLLLSVSNNLVRSWDTRSSYNPGTEQREENMSDLNEKAWQVVKAPDRKADDYREALRQIEIAAKADPRSPSELNTLGVAQYRNGLFREALESLRRSEELQYDSVNLVFTAMAHFKLGEVDQARGELRTVQDRLKAGPVDARAFLGEAEALIEDARKK